MAKATKWTRRAKYVQARHRASGLTGRLLLRTSPLHKISLIASRAHGFGGNAEARLEWLALRRVVGLLRARTFNVVVGGFNLDLAEFSIHFAAFVG